MSAGFILENLLNGIVDGNNINIFFIIILKYMKIQIIFVLV